jgi:hypothetical protein
MSSYLISSFWRTQQSRYLLPLTWGQKQIQFPKRCVVYVWIYQVFFLPKISVTFGWNRNTQLKWTHGIPLNSISRCQERHLLGCWTVMYLVTRVNILSWHGADGKTTAGWFLLLQTLWRLRLTLRGTATLPAPHLPHFRPTQAWDLSWRRREVVHTRKLHVLIFWYEVAACECRGGLYGCETLRILHCLGTHLTHGPTHRPRSTAPETSFFCFWYSFLLEAE